MQHNVAQPSLLTVPNLITSVQLFERELALLVAFQGESIWKGGGGCWGDINLRRQKTGDKATQTWIEALIIVAKA